MNRKPTETTPGDVLVCGDCGRVNPIPKGLTRNTAVRCSGCGVLLCGERQRKVAINCPNCQIRLEIDADWLGQMVACGNCRTDFVAERPRDRAIPAAPKAEDEKAPDGVVTGVGIVDMFEEDAEADSGLRRKVRRTRKRKRTREKSTKGRFRAIAATMLTFGAVAGIIAEVGRRSEWWLVPPTEPIPGVGVTFETLEATPAEMTAEDGKAMDEVLGRFFRAVSPEDALAVCRFQGEVGGRMRAVASTLTTPPIQPVGMRISSKHAVRERLFLRLTGQSSTDTGSPLSVVLERSAPGKFLADWDSYVRFASEPWGNFIVKRDGTPGRFQLRVKRQFVGNISYAIEDWTSFLVFWDEESDGVHLFVRTISPDCESLLAATDLDKKVPEIEVVRGVGGEFPVTLEVFFPAETNQPGMPPALELKKFCHSGWVDLSEG
ncbi:MAG: hypothetical protein ACKO2G_14150 [Verrucomicrobiales bacterium]